MNPLPLSRRRALTATAGFGLSLSFLGRQSFAASEGDLAKKKLVVVVCRGGMDGLSLAPPIGDPDYQELRRNLALSAGEVLKLDGDFALHPALTSVHALAQKGQARIAPAVATPDRARSHFEAQDVLESGGAVVYGTASGWLNRAVGAMGKARKIEALAVGSTTPLILRGPVQAASWSPGRGVDSQSRLPALLQDLYRDDPVLGPALARGLATDAMAQAAMEGQPGAMTQVRPGQGAQGREVARQLGTTLAGFMRKADGPQIAAVSVDGFDTHANQGAAQGQLANRLAYLDAFLDGLNTGLAESWSDTVVVAATEFGRTARANGTNGTDHGTASTALLLGGALKGQGIVGDWPGLKASALFEGRDLAPALDMRSLFKGVLEAHLGLDRRTLDSEVFPGSAAVKPAAMVA